jgi:N-acetylneuraminic acid mutarotase
MRIHPACLVFAVAVALTTGLTACGGGGDGGSPPKIAPSISNLTYSPTAVYVNSGGGTGTVTGTFSYTDANGGLASVTLTVTDASGVTVTRTATPIPAGTPPTIGTLQGSVTFGTTVAGNYTIRVSVTDVAGLVSNELTGSFRIAPQPWVSKAPVPNASSMGFLYLAAASGGRLYVIGDVLAPLTLRIYDVATDTWTTGPTMPNAHGAWPVAAAVNGVVYVIGGADSSAQALSTVDAFDTATGTWSTKKPMPTARYSAAAAVINNRICVAGGMNIFSGLAGTPALNAMECYDPVTDSWSSGPTMPTGRQGLGSDALGSFAYAVGGNCCLGPAFQPLATVERYDAAANTWSTVAPLPTARNFVAVVNAGGLLYAIGGYGAGPSGSLPTVEAYDPSAAAWKAKTPLPPSVWGVSAVQSGGVIYVFDQDGRTWQYTPANDIL